ncbi:hypothetical protein [Longitalea luteola]|uniref:hypothetical protein n=1 Tax=Longitalea luteola TaxID=2812563 RepID=UPI001A96F4F2|nr:hypothetical protein [Longitalea luteola]
MEVQKEYVRDFNSVLVDFLTVAAEDPRISPIHISLYAAILHQYKLQEYKLPVSVYSKDLMRLAKISAKTYHKSMQELHRYGFIHYLPSYNPVLGSLVYPIKLNAA